MGDLLDPTHAHQRGEVRTTPLGKEVVYRSGCWVLDAEEQVPADLNSQIVAILDRVTQDLGVWRTLSSQYRVDLFCGLFMQRADEGFSLHPATMQLLAERGIEFAIDLYAPDIAG